MQWLFWVICQNKKSSMGLAFGVYFLYVPYLILYQWTRFQCHNFFPSQDIKRNVLLRSRLDS